MKINVIRSSCGGALRSVSKNFYRHLRNLNVSVFYNKRVVDADVQFFMFYKDYARLSDCPTKYFDVVFFTHKKVSAKKAWENSASLCDLCVAQSKTTSIYLPKNKTIIVKPGIDDKFVEQIDDIKIGVVSTNQRRKNIYLVERLNKIEGIQVIPTLNSVPSSEIVNFYKEMDYILILSSLEGGPLPFLEALAVRKPVIAPIGVGWCDDYTAIKYTNIEQLINLLKNLVIKKNHWEIECQKLIQEIRKRLWTLDG